MYWVQSWIAAFQDWRDFRACDTEQEAIKVAQDRYADGDDVRVVNLWGDAIYGRSHEIDMLGWTAYNISAD